MGVKIVKRNRVGTIQKKILLLLLGGLALGFSRSPRGQLRIIRAMRDEWRVIDRHALYQAMRRLYQSQLVEERHNDDGSLTMILSAEGKWRALTFTAEDIEIAKPKVWDKKWRVVVFDIPERRRGLRDIFRARLRHMMFYELQKSVFVHPYPCQDQIDFLVELYGARQYVRIIVAESLDNALHLKTHFKLS